MNWISPLFRILGALLLAAVVGYAIAFGGIASGFLFLVLPFIVLFLGVSFWKPEILMFTAVAMGFLISVLSRYIPGNIPFGLSIDGLIVICIVVLIFDKRQKFETNYLINPLSLALMVWLVFTTLMVVNPLAKSKEAWFYAIRGLSFYPYFLAILFMYICTSFDQIRRLLWIWAGFAVFGTFWGMKQLFMGVSHVEQRWLDAGAASTHILFGKLRIFSYFSDAAQFGASQAHTALVFGIIGFYAGALKHRWVYLIIALLCFYGMLISGTRGALAIIALGGFTYLLLTKRFKIIVLGIFMAVGAFSFLKYTTILQSNYQVNRLRTALNADDPSLMVRKERERVLKSYLSDKPIGGGIGSAGYWGKRFTPGTFLAEIGTDGHYTRIWMETGFVGLLLYLILLMVIIFYLGTQLWKMEESLLRQILVAFYSGFTGLCLASYTNGLLTQMPTGIIVFMSLATIYVGTTNQMDKKKLLS